MGEPNKSYNQTGSWSPQQSGNWQDLRGLEGAVESATNIFERAVGDRNLARPLASLYFAEVLPEADKATKQSAYLSAFLGFEGYRSNMEFHSRDRNPENIVPPELERYLGICDQLSDYCRSKVGYLGNAQPKKE